MNLPRTALCAVLLAAAIGVAACSRGAGEPLVAVFCLDGVHPDLVDELRAEGRMPNLDRLMRAGTSGALRSVEAWRINLARPREGYYSPVVWTSLATGMVPEKHGVLDFALPRAGTAWAWIGTAEGAPVGVLRLPELDADVAATFRLRLRSTADNGVQPVRVLLNGQALAVLQVPAVWQDFDVPVLRGALRPALNRLELAFSRQASLPDAAPRQAPVAGGFAGLDVLERDGTPVLRVDPMLDRRRLTRGFHAPEAELVEAQSVHWKAPAIWTRLGESGHPVGIVGHWATWPAYPVNGFLVSSHMGLRGGKRKSALPQLTWPDELVQELMPLAPSDAELDALAGKLIPAGCVPDRLDKLAVFRSLLWQDELFFRIAKRQLPDMRHGLFTVYFESTDVGSHRYLALRDGGRPLPPGCGEDAKRIVDRIYEQTDRWLGELVALLPPEATVIVLSDHGLESRGARAEHTPYGILVAAGPRIRRGARIWGASILDVAPTLLHLFGEPIPLDMDGKPLAALFDERWLAARAPRYAAASRMAEAEATPSSEASDEVLERLEGIGYMQ
jgi:predicted AlkP superfamily phosphohydrolase/phosphomutase